MPSASAWTCCNADEPLKAGALSAATLSEAGEGEADEAAAASVDGDA
jgi:hypothetical protein